MLLSYVCVLVMVGGMLLWAYAKGDAKEIGRAMLWIGMFYTLALFAGRTARLL